MYARPLRPAGRAARLVALLALAAATLLAAVAPLAGLPVAGGTATALAQAAGSGPQPGEVFRQFTFTTNTALCFSSPGNCAGTTSQADRNLSVDTRGDVTRAELVLEYWGGHINTANQRYRVNGAAFKPLPQPQNMPAESAPRCYFRNVTNAIEALPIGGAGGLKANQSSNNQFTFAIDAQNSIPECAGNSSSGWAHMYIYSFSPRVYYNPATTASPRGTITAPAGGGTFGENPTITVDASPSSGRTISRVDLIGNYLDYDWDGDGALQDWQYALRKGVWEQTIGTFPNPTGRTNASRSGNTFTFQWNTTWLPDQGQPVQLMARITDNAGYSYMTPIVSATFARSGRSVQMYTTSHNLYGTWYYGPPRNYAIHTYSLAGGTGKTATVTVPHPLAGATEARMVISTWSADPSGNPCEDDADGDGNPCEPGERANPGTEVWIGSHKAFSGRFGRYHDYSIDTATVPVSALATGDNTLRIWSNRTNHALEVNWPGPAVLVAYPTAPTIPSPVAGDLTVNTQEDTPVALALPVTNPAKLRLTYSFPQQPQGGALSGRAPNLTYTPAADVSGADGFTYQVTDQYGNSDTGQVTLNVGAVADPPQIDVGPVVSQAFDTPLSRVGSFSDPDSTSWTATVDYGDGSAEQPLALGADKTFVLSHTYSRAGSFPVTVSINDGAATAQAVLTVNAISPGSATSANWWNSAWRYRLPVNVGAGSFPRSDKVAELDVNFTSALQALGASGPLQQSSLRVVEVDGGGAVTDESVPFQFEPASGYNATSNARGTLLLQLKGGTPAGATRRYHVYFETTGTFAPASFTPQVVVTNPSLPNYKKDSAAVIETRDRQGTRTATYYYHLNGGGFASLLDRQGVDWISYSTSAGGSGEFRGIPNAGAVFHPGYTLDYASGAGNTTGSLQRSNTTIVQEGPLKVTLRSVSSNGQWEALWDIFPTSTRMTVVRAPTVYWWLYEGTPGGTLNGADTVVRASGEATPAHNTGSSWNTDLPGSEWTYIRAAEAAQGGRAIFLAHHDDADVQKDLYRSLTEGTNDASRMTVFGFGRAEDTLLRLLNGQRRFSFGLIEAAPATYNGDTALAVEGIYRDLGATLGAAQRQITNFAPVAGDDSYRTLPNQTLNVAAPGILGNDSDAEGGALTINVTAQPASGSLTVNPNGSLSYTPAAGFEGQVSFSYTVGDGALTSQPATATIRVSANLPPVGTADSYSVKARGTLTVGGSGVLGNDSDPEGDSLTVQVADQPSNGALTLNPNGSFTYTPSPSFSGVDTFTYIIKDQVGQSSPVTVQITVQNTRPSAAGESFFTLRNTALPISVQQLLANDSDGDGDALTPVVLTNPASGTLAIAGDGSLVYTPGADFIGTDSFTYAASDGVDQSDPVTVTINVTDGELKVFIPVVGR